ncbi:nucleoid-associated protein [Chitinimonas sp. PSY-7]|uniref:nucleoid-associated protein n=1 Tax=Chitinimonas sp. PSY-7 TaxID=3459088 RepID=UPI00403FEB37
MTAPLNTIRNLVIHHLQKDAHGPATIALRAGQLPITASAQRLVDKLCKQYGERVGKGYGRFEEDEDNFPMPRFVRQHVVEEAIDFITLAQLMMQHLLTRVEQEQLANGGHVLIARVDNGAADFLLVAIISEAVGTSMTEDLDIIETIHLDLTNLRVAGRIDLDAWRRGAERYISFLKGRGEVANYFKLFLGCNDVVVALRETQKLVQGLAQFAESQALPPTQRDQLFERAHVFLDELGDEGLPLSLDQIANKAWPDAPERLQNQLADQDLALSSGFIPDKRAIKPLVRFKANAPQWKLEFDRSSLRSGAVIYDKHSDTLVLSNIPEHLRQALLSS